MGVGNVVITASRAGVCSKACQAHKRKRRFAGVMFSVNAIYTI